jgi:hypothetical protein
MIVGGYTRRLHEKIIDDADKKDIKIIVDEVRILEEKVSKIINLAKNFNE